MPISDLSTAFGIGDISPTAEDIANAPRPGELQCVDQITGEWRDRTPAEIRAMAERHVVVPSCPPPQEPTDEMLNAHLRATGDWIEAHVAERESGVSIECDISQDDADALNAMARNDLRKGYAAAYSVSRPVSGEVTRIATGIEPGQQMEGVLIMSDLPQTAGNPAAVILPTKLTGEIACILEDCSPPDKQTPEAVAALIEGYQSTWDAIVAALSAGVGATPGDGA